jgi:hypothetical protein
MVSACRAPLTHTATGKNPVINFYRNADIYHANSGSDADDDGMRAALSSGRRRIKRSPLRLGRYRFVRATSVQGAAAWGRHWS